MYSHLIQKVNFHKPMKQSHVKRSCVMYSIYRHHSSRNIFSSTQDCTLSIVLHGKFKEINYLYMITLSSAQICISLPETVCDFFFPLLFSFSLWIWTLNSSIENEKKKIKPQLWFRVLFHECLKNLLIRSLLLFQPTKDHYVCRVSFSC